MTRDPVYSAHTEDPSKPFELPLETIVDDLTINTVSAWAAARESVKCFEQLDDQSGVFIHSGNLFSETVAPSFLSFGMGKSAAAHLVQNLAQTAFQDKPYR